MSIRVCPHCGEYNHASTKLCTACGQSTEASAPLPPAIDAADIEGPPEEIGTGIYRLADGDVVGNEPESLEGY